MSELKCPYCQQELLLSSFRMGEEDYQMWNCLYCGLSAHRKIWDKIIRTRKVLDVAVDALKELKPQKAKGGGYWVVKSADAIKLINTTLKQITAILENKRK